MKESMNVSKSVVWSLLDLSMQQKLLDDSEKNKYYGLHIHVPEGATPKDGPSAGVAITVVLYSLLMRKRVNKDFAMTGEISLQGNVTAIGGLDLKIMGGLESGATKFIYPKDNEKDFNDFVENLSDKTIIENIEFYSVNNINDVLKLIYVD